MNYKKGGLSVQVVDGVQIMNNFNDLENDLAGDWLDVQRKIQEYDEKEREYNSPKRMHCSYRRFYQKLYKIALDGVNLDRSMELHEILRMVFTGSREMPKGFERIWDAFCNSYEYDTNTIECMSCGEKYDILYKITRPMVSYNFGQGIADSIEIRMDAIYCPKCSRIIGRLERGTFISLTTNNIHVKSMEERNDIKHKF